jgi:hypothetical protein
MKLGFSSQIISKILKISDFIKIHPVGAALFHTARWRNIQDKVNSHFLGNAPKN